VGGGVCGNGDKARVGLLKCDVDAAVRFLLYRDGVVLLGNGVHPSIVPVNGDVRCLFTFSEHSVNIQ
jgi:hypothetical protein